MRIRPYLSVLAPVIASVALLAGLQASLASAALADGPGLSVQRVDATQFPTVRAYVSVANSSGVPITGLNADAFQVQEDGKPVPGLQVDSIVDSTEPIAIALVMDRSGSMEGPKLAQAKVAAAGMLDALGAGDRVTIVGFADDVSVLQERTDDRNALKAALDQLTAKGNTHLYDAVTESARQLAKQPERRKVLLVLTDGEDRQSSASLENSIAAATAAGSPVYAIGLGSDVSHDVLDKLAGSTGGQAVYVDDPGQLRQTFLEVADQLRRLYVVRYQSALASDQKPHGLAIQVAYAGQQATALGTFTMSSPPDVTVTGLDLSAPASGVQHVTVDVPNGAQFVQLLVDDQARGLVRVAPFVFDWDTSRETAGAHRVVIRVTDLRNGSSDRTYNVTVAGPSPAPTSGTVPTPAPAPTPLPQPDPPALGRAPTDALLPAAVLLVLLLAGIGAWFFADPRRRPPPHASEAPASDTSPASDQTDIIPGSVLDTDSTYIRDAPPPSGRARLLIARGGEQHEVAFDRPELTLGRDDSSDVPIEDPRASRKHCRISSEDGLFWVEDLRSLNGTQVNGEPVQRRQLANGDRITIGETVVTLAANDSRRR